MAKHSEKELLSQAEIISNFGIWELDIKANALSWSDGVFRICGYEPKEFEVTYEKNLSVIHPDDRAIFIEQIQNTITTGKEFDVRKRFITKDGSIKHINSKGKLIKDFNGNGIKISGVFQDISQTVALETAYQKITSDLEALIENTPDIIYSLNIDFELVTFNSAFKKIVSELGLGKVEKGMNVFKLYTEEKRELYSAVFLIVKEGKRYTFEDELLISGKLVCYDVSVNPILNEKEEVIGVSIFSKDVTEKKQKEKELERIKINQDAIINSTQDLIWSINTKMQLITANSAFYKMIKDDTGKIIKEGDYIIVDEYPKEINDKWLNYYTRGLNGETFTENYTEDFNGKLIYNLISFSPMFNAKEEVLGLACYTKDITKEKLIFLALERKDTELEKIMNSSLDVICTINKEGKFIKINAASERVWGYKPEELVGKHQNLLVYPDDIELTSTTIDKVQSGVNVFNFENRNIKKDGTVIPMIWSATFDEKEEITYCIAKDASIIKKKDRELKRANDILKNAQKITKMGNWEYNLETDELFWSDEVYRIFEIEKDVNKKLSFQDFEYFIHPDDISKVIEAKNTTVTSGEILNVQHRIITKKKREKYIKEIAEKVFNKETNSFWLYGTIRDNTEAVSNQNKIETSEKKYKHLFENNPSVMVLYDFETLKIIDCNKEALELYGYTKEELLNLSIRDVRPAEDVDLINKATKNENSYGQIHKAIYRHQKKSGEIIHVDVTGHLIDYEGRRCSLVLINDITENKKAEQLVIESEVKYRTMIESSMDAMLLTIKNGGILSTNAAACQIFQMTNEEIIAAGRNGLVDITDPRLVPLLEERERVGKIRGELTFKRKDGTKFPGEITSVVFIDGNGLEKTSMIIRDITVQKNADKEILESNQRYNYVTKATFDTVWDWDLTTDLLHWGEGFNTILGYGSLENETESKSWTNKIHPDDYDRVIKGVHLCINSKAFDENWTDEYRFLKADGTYAFVQDKGLIVRNDKNQAIRMVGAMQDITQKKKENLRLKLLESVVTNTKDAVLITEAEPLDEPGPKILYVNEAFSKMTGYAAEDVIGKTPRILQGPKTDKKELEKVSKALRNWEPCEITVINYKKNGEEFYINFAVSPVADHKGMYTHWIAIERDVTESVLAQQKLNSSLEERNTILESIDDGFFAVDKNSIVTYWNKKAELLLGEKRENVIGKNLHQMFANSNSMGFHDHYQKAIKNNTTVHFEEYSVRSNKWFEVSAFASDNGLSVYFKDVTDKKTIEERIKSERNLLRTLIDNLPDTIYVKDIDARKIISNKNDYNFIGFDHEEDVLGKTDLELFKDETARTGYNHDIEIIKAGKSLVNYEQHIIKNDGSPMWLLTTKVPLKNNENKIIGLLGIGRDITGIKDAQERIKNVNNELEKSVEQLQISNKELEQFAYVASHDLQEPLRMITSFLTQIEKKYNDVLDDKGKQYIYFAVDGAKRMRQIILDLLDYSRVGRHDEELEEVNLMDIITEIQSLYRKQIDEISAKIETGDLPQILSYKTPIRQVLQNLISNALKYHTKGILLEIKLDVEDKGNYWQFYVKDNGIGINEEYFQKIFIIFQRLHNKEEYSGTGMGLAICKKIVDSLGGKIWVEANSNQGSCFYFTIPKIKI